MKLLFTSYVSTPEYSQPGEWLKRIEGFTGIMESLSHDHTVLSIERINYEGEYDQGGVHYFFIKQKKKTVRFPFRMHRLVKKLQPDVVFISGFIFPLQIVQLRLALGKRVKIIVFHQAERPFSGIKKYFQKLADKYINAFLFASSEFSGQWTKDGNISDQKKIYEVLHGSSVFKPGDKEAAKEALAITGSPVFLWIGRLDDNKDPVTVTKAFISFLQYQPFAKLYMIYHTEELLDKVSDLIKQHEKAAQAIKLIGKVQHRELQSWYDSADFIISGSHYEGGGIAVCEAMSCGCIPVISDIMSFRKMTGPGKCGVLYQAGNEKELLQALLKTNEMNIDAEREKVLRQFREELSFEAIAKKIGAVIASV
jgi:glycosyltransferase involved in cell wall biosynthesis